MQLRVGGRPTQDCHGRRPSKEAIQTVVPCIAIADHAPRIPSIYEQTGFQVCLAFCGEDPIRNPRQIKGLDFRITGLDRLQGFSPQGGIVTQEKGECTATHLSQVDTLEMLLCGAEEDIFPHAAHFLHKFLPLSFIIPKEVLVVRLLLSVKGKANHIDDMNRSEGNTILRHRSLAIHGDVRHQPFWCAASIGSSLIAELLQ
mmetsp:Transcript_26157/g.31822  ORF Transcript_26157/g.31822 Transcript_26157/m.31822 type:complete len:201 (+) Transcript_26157:179-781(+)